MPKQYRAERRNLRRPQGPGDKRKPWAGAPARYEPYQVKPPALKNVTSYFFGVALTMRALMPRKQPKTYPYASRKRGGVSLLAAAE